MWVCGHDRLDPGGSYVGRDGGQKGSPLEVQSMGTKSGGISGGGEQ